MRGEGIYEMSADDAFQLVAEFRATMRSIETGRGPIVSQLLLAG